MEEPNQNDPMREAHLLSKMREKETEELLAIWQQNDRQAWTDDAFDAIHKVLHERLIDVLNKDCLLHPPAGALIELASIPLRRGPILFHGLS